jgi:hypothetical protein
MAKATDGSVWFKRADNRRVGLRGAMGGWDQLCARLKGSDDGRPMLYVFSTCRDFIRTVPAMQHDSTRAEDVDTEGEDHCGDQTRYAVMSRPYAIADSKTPTDMIAELCRPKTLNEMVELFEKEQRENENYQDADSVMTFQ